MKAGFTIKKRPVQNGAGSTYVLRGWLNGSRVRKQFKELEEAEGEKLRLEIQASNAHVRPVITRLSDQQVAEAESAIALLGSKPLLGAVQWYLANYKPQVADIPVEVARDAFIADRTPHISKGALKDYTRTLRDLSALFPGRAVHAFTATDIESVLKKFASSGPKRHNSRICTCMCSRKSASPRAKGCGQSSKACASGMP